MKLLQHYVDTQHQKRYTYLVAANNLTKNYNICTLHISFGQVDVLPSTCGACGKECFTRFFATSILFCRLTFIISLWSQLEKVHVMSMLLSHYLHDQAWNGAHMNTYLFFFVNFLLKFVLSKKERLRLISYLSERTCVIVHS